MCPQQLILLLLVVHSGHSSEHESIHTRHSRRARWTNYKNARHYSPLMSRLLPGTHSVAPPAVNRPRMMRAQSTDSGMMTNYVARCGSCEGEPSSAVCGSDGKTYDSRCELELASCRMYWNIKVASSGPCEAECPGLETLGMYSGFGLSRASNKGYCIHDFFRCVKVVESPNKKSCCQGRFDKCMQFIESKPWKAGVEMYGR